MADYLTQEDIARFQEDGAICLRRVFDNEWLAKVERGIEKNLAQPSQYSEKLRGQTGSGFYFNDYCNWQTIDEFRDFAFNSPAPELAALLMQSEVSFGRDNFPASILIFPAGLHY